MMLLKSKQKDRQLPVFFFESQLIKIRQFLELLKGSPHSPAFQIFQSFF